MSDKLISALIGAFVGSVVGPLVSWLLEIVNRHKSRSEAAAALRFEIASNVLWLNSIPASLNYLRDEAWATMKNKGYISYLKSPLPMMIARTYDRMHSLNGQIRVMRKLKSIDDRTTKEVIERIDDLRQMSEKLMYHFDQEYPRLGKNYKE